MKKLLLNLLLIVFIIGNYTNLYADPVVLRANPTISQKNVKTNTSIEVFFNEEMDSKSINESNFKVVDEAGKDVKGSIVYDKDQKKASFKADSILKEGTVYLVVLSHEIKNDKGKTIGQPYRWVFKTEGKSKTKVTKTKKQKTKKVISKLLPPSVSSPKNKSTVTNKVKFEWKGSADKYQIKIFKGKKLVLDKKLTGNSFEFGRDLPKGTYTWKIRAAKGKKWSGFSQKMYFIIQN